MCSCSGSCDCNSVTVPRGPQGPQGGIGPQGPIGNTGPRGFTGLTGPQGFSGVVDVEAPITNTGTSNFAILGIDINELITLINTTNTGGGFIPTGAIIAFGALTPPAGWLVCNGTAVSRSGANAALYAVVGDTYGNGDGSSTFNLPDLRQKVPVGYDFTTPPFNTLGHTDGVTINTINQANLPTHTHDKGTLSNSASEVELYLRYADVAGGTQDFVFNAGNYNGSTYNGITHNHTITGNVGDGAGTFLSTPLDNMQPYLVINYIIKL